MDVLAEVRQLKLPLGEYIVLGSGILGVLGIREINDIDLLVTEKIFNQLRASEGWVFDVVQIEGRSRERLSCEGKKFEVYKDFWYGGNEIDSKELISSAEVIHGIAFLTLEKLKEIKQVLNRDKDIKDISLIDEYLKKST
jgi:hypothetical protein